MSLRYAGWPRLMDPSAFCWVRVPRYCRVRPKFVIIMYLYVMGIEKEVYAAAANDAPFGDRVRIGQDYVKPKI